MFTVIKRDGAIAPYQSHYIYNAILRANGELPKNTLGVSTDKLDALIECVEQRFTPNEEGSIRVEDIQDLVEDELMSIHHPLAKLYILYRQRQEERRKLEVNPYIRQAVKLIKSVSQDLQVDLLLIVEQLDLPEDEAPTTTEILNQVILKVLDIIETSDDYDYLAGRLVLLKTRLVANAEMESRYNLKDPQLTDIVTILTEEGLYDATLFEEFPEWKDLIDVTRDNHFSYVGATTLADRYLVRNRNGVVLETPQLMFMRVALALSKHGTLSIDAIYSCLSTFMYFHSTPSLFNGGLVRPQMSSCYLSTIPSDSLKGIMDLLQENAQLSKWAGGLGIDWTPVRAAGAKIKGTNGHSDGVIPFIKIGEAMAAAVNQGSELIAA